MPSGLTAFMVGRCFSSFHQHSASLLRNLLGVSVPANHAPSLVAGIIMRGGDLSQIIYLHFTESSIWQNPHFG